MRIPKSSTTGIFRRVALPIILTAASIGSLATIQKHVDSLRRIDTGDQMLYFPNDKLLRYFTAGMDNVIADFMWYRTVQYVAHEFSLQRTKLVWLEHMTKVVTYLDPHYEDAFRYGGLFLAIIDAEELGIPILKEGMIQNPNSWVLPYELHTIFLVNRSDDPAAAVLASRYALMVAERRHDNYKKFYLELARNLLSGKDMHDEAIAMLTMTVKDATEPLLKKQAEVQLRAAYIDKNVAVLREAAEAYAEKYDRKTESVQDLFESGFINAVPDNPDEGNYFVDAVGNIQNSFSIADYESRTKRKIERHIDEYRNDNNRNPSDLDELVAYSKSRPYVHPLPGKEWYYDPATNQTSVQ